jgi:RND superfamily putative drug exporter
VHRDFAKVVSGRRMKWVVVAFWVVATFVLGAFGAKLADVENNETVSWLPGSAESTQALEKVSAFAPTPHSTRYWSTSATAGSPPQT